MARRSKKSKSHSNGSPTTLPLAAIERLIRKAGAERVSECAAQELGVVLEQIATELSAKAVKISRHAGRVTVTADDIKIAR
ncbi:MAG: histone [Candidatus Micrarchaeota archaeon]